MSKSLVVDIRMQKLMMHLRENHASWVPFLSAQAFGGRVHVLPTVPTESQTHNFGVHDLLLIEEASEEELFQLGRRTSAAIYLPRESDLADGVLTKADYVGFEALELDFSPIVFADGEADAYFMEGCRSREGLAVKPAIFLDRDGTIIELVPYVKDPNLVRLMDGVAEFLKSAVAKGYLLVCVTNQSGLGRGFYDLGEFQAVQDKMHSLLAESHVHLDASFFAGYFAESDNLVWAGRPGLRKPRAGMLLEAARRLNIDMGASIMIGDSLVDMKVGAAVGVKSIYQIRGPKIALGHHDRVAQKIEEFSEIPL